MSAALKFETIIINHLQQGDTHSAASALNSWVPNKAEEKLRWLFCQGKTYLYEGSYIKALDTLQNYLKAQPDDIGALCDIMLCFYQLGLQTDLDNYIDRCMPLFKEHAKQFSSQKNIDNGIFVTKLLEERGSHIEAMEILSLLRVNLTPKQERALDIQALRLSVELRDEKLTRKLYTKVLRGVDHNLSFEIEREHSLLLADMFIFGFQAAQERFEYISRKSIGKPNLEFLISEITEQAILS